MDCGEDDPVVLQLDHVRGIKTATINYLLNGARSFERLVVEVAKCEVVCANCHFRRTAKRHGNWWKEKQNTSPGGGMVDALVLGTSGRKLVKVRLLFWA